MTALVSVGGDTAQCETAEHTAVPLGDAPSTIAERLQQVLTAALGRSSAALDTAARQRPLLLAVSGGADSMAMWSLIAGLGWPYAIYHLDHGLREEAYRDGELIRAHAQALHRRGRGPQALELERCDIAALAVEWRCGEEAAGRRQRYVRLVEWGVRLAAQAVLTAHHRDDQAETLLANLLRGASLIGQCGIARERQLAPGLPLLRPLLDCGRDDLRAYCQEAGLAWHEDASNADTRLNRNFLRHRVLPLLESGVPGLTAELVRLADRSAAALRASAPLVDEAWCRLIRPGNLLLLDDLCALPPVLRPHLWRRFHVHLGIEPSRRGIHELERLAAGACGTQATLGRWLLQRRAQGITWQEQHPRASQECVLLPGPGRFQRAGETITCSLTSAPALSPAQLRGGPDCAMLAGEACTWPLQWRLSQAHERWQPLGCPGRQSLAKYLSSRGVASRMRALTPVLADSQGLLWVPGHGIAERARVTPATTLQLRLQWSPLGTRDDSTRIVPTIVPTSGD